MHPLHDIALPETIEQGFPVVVEIPAGSKLKYEIDKDTGFLMLDRVLFSAVHYPANYGFVPRTHAGDDDPIDVLVLMQAPVHPGCIVEARAIGGFRMVDDKGVDDKIIAVATKDPVFNSYTSMEQLPEHLVKELRQFFIDYKVLEKKSVKVDGDFTKDEANQAVRDSIAGYKAKFQKG